MHPYSPPRSPAASNNDLFLYSITTPCILHHCLQALMASLDQKLQQLQEILDSDFITQVEFEQRRAALLEEYGVSAVRSSLKLSFKRFNNCLNAALILPIVLISLFINILFNEHSRPGSSTSAGPSISFLEIVDVASTRRFSFCSEYHLHLSSLSYVCRVTRQRIHRALYCPRRAASTLCPESSTKSTSASRSAVIVVFSKIDVIYRFTKIPDVFLKVGDFSRATKTILSLNYYNDSSRGILSFPPHLPSSLFSLPQFILWSDCWLSQYCLLSD